MRKGEQKEKPGKILFQQNDYFSHWNGGETEDKIYGALKYPFFFFFP